MPRGVRRARSARSSRRVKSKSAAVSSSCQRDRPILLGSPVVRSRSLRRDETNRVIVARRVPDDVREGGRQRHGVERGLRPMKPQVIGVVEIARLEQRVRLGQVDVRKARGGLRRIQAKERRAEAYTLLEPSYLYNTDD